MARTQALDLKYTNQYDKSCLNSFGTRLSLKQPPGATWGLNGTVFDAGLMMYSG
jgi:hypothetical protein